jgi:sugar phosphate isomerase/epimerase
MAFARAFSTIGCPQSSLAEALGLAERHGLDGVELRVLGGGMDLPAYLKANHGTPSALALGLGIDAARILALDTSLNLIGGSQDDRDRFLEFVPWAEALGVRWLRVFDGGRAGDAGGIAEAASCLEWWRRTRAERSWRPDIMVETHGSLTTAAAIGRLLEEAPATAILWDTHHTWRKGGEDPVATWRAIRRSVVHVHVKDSSGVPGPRHPYTYVLPGSGEFPMPALLRELRAEFGGTVSLEWEKLWHPELPDLGSALSAAEARCWW